MDSFCMAVVVNRYPKLGEHIRVSTWATDFTGLFGLRNFKMEDEAGEMTAWAIRLGIYGYEKRKTMQTRRKKRSRLIGRKHHWM